MNPTLWAASHQVRCKECRITTRIDQTIWQQAVESRSFTCWHCGDRQFGEVIQSMPPDIIRVVHHDTPIYRGGDLVMIRKSLEHAENIHSEPTLHVKRILAVPGQTISVDDHGDLLVDGLRLKTDEQPPLLVDSSVHRDTSLQNPSRWHSADDGWLVYENVSIYRAGKPSPIRKPCPIMDDYPGNLGLARKLYPVDRLSIVISLPKTLPLVDHSSVQSRWWTRQGIVQTQQSFTTEALTNPIRLRGPEGNTATRFTSIPDSTPNDLSPSRPIAIRLIANPSSDADSTVKSLGPIRPTAIRPISIQPISIQVERSVQYRVPSLSKANSSVRYPIRLSPDQCFVVGDNAPVSIDSRHFGPVEFENLIGHVEKSLDQSQPEK